MELAVNRQPDGEWGRGKSSSKFNYYETTQATS